MAITVTLAGNATQMREADALALAYGILEHVSEAARGSREDTPCCGDFVMHQPAVTVHREPEEGREPLVCLTARIARGPAVWLWFSAGEAAALATSIFRFTGNATGRLN